MDRRGRERAGKETTMPIDLAAVDWFYVIVLAILVFISTVIGTALALRHIFLGALFSSLLFAAGFVFWTYSPHGLPFPTRLSTKSSAAPVKPANPVTDITPPGGVGPAPASPANPR